MVGSAAAGSRPTADSSSSSTTRTKRSTTYLSSCIIRRATMLDGPRAEGLLDSGKFESRAEVGKPDCVWMFGGERPRRKLKTQNNHSPVPRLTRPQLHRESEMRTNEMASLRRLGDSRRAP